MKILESEQRNEIANFIIEASAQGKEFMVWQRSNEEQLLFQTKGKLEEQFGSDQFILKLYESVEIDPLRPIYFAIMDSSLAFKTDKMTIDGDLLTIEAPAKIHYKERRKHPRKKFRPRDIKQVEISYTPVSDLEGELPVILTSMLDVSEGGLCVLISVEELRKIDKDIHLNIRSLCSDVILASDKAKIVHTRKYQTSKGLGMGNLFAIGLMFV